MQGSKAKGASQWLMGFIPLQVAQPPSWTLGATEQAIHRSWLEQLNKANLS